MFDRYREERRRVNTVVREAKRNTEERFGTKLSQNFEGNKKMFWEEVKRVRAERSTGRGDESKG